MKMVEVERGTGPIVLGLPHTGTWLPDDVAARLNDLGRALADTDWHIDRLYDGLIDGATTVRATYHRYLIDANRDPDGASLYPGQNTTGLVPLTDFDGRPIWDLPPETDEIEDRRRRYHAPYHAALAAELQGTVRRHGIAILYDCHSIRSHIPYLFDGTLPDFNIGTNDGESCAAILEARVAATCKAHPEYSSVLNGRFKGGWTTRHYGRPAQGIHAIQMELAQSAYLAEETLPWRYDMAKATRLRHVLTDILQSLADLAPRLGKTK